MSDHRAGSLDAVAAARVLAEGEVREARVRVGARRRFEEVEVDRRCSEARRPVEPALAPVRRSARREATVAVAERIDRRGRIGRNVRVEPGIREAGEERFGVRGDEGLEHETRAAEDVVAREAGEGIELRAAGGARSAIVEALARALVGSSSCEERFYNVQPVPPEVTG